MDLAHQQGRGEEPAKNPLQLAPPMTIYSRQLQMLGGKHDEFIHQDFIVLYVQSRSPTARYDMCMDTYIFLI